ncbi:MAG: hypothetical protein AB8B96_19550 [Lysobacterales bacterium]
MDEFAHPPDRFSTARGQKPQFHADPAIDDLMGMVVALTGEVAVLRERLDTHERLSASGEAFSAHQVDGFEPDSQSQIVRNQMRETLIKRVFRPAMARETLSAAETHASVVDEIEGKQ